MKNILVVVDMQKDFIDGALGTKEAVAIVPEVVKEIRKDKYDEVLATKDTHDAHYLQTLEGKYLPVEHCIKGTPGFEIQKDVREALEKRHVRIFEKPVFGSLELQKYLEETQPDSVTFVGLCTDICVVSNALSAKMVLKHGEVNVVAKATAGVSEKAKEAALQTMQSCQIHIL